MDLLLTGIALLGVLLTWRYIWRPTMVADTRDRLFDVRDDLRATFAAVDKLDHPDYLAARSLLNAEIRYIERSSLIASSVALSMLKQMDPAKIQLPVFSVSDETLRDSLRKARMSASDLVLGHLVTSSPIWFPLALVGLPFFIIGMLVKRTSLTMSRLRERCVAWMRRLLGPDIDRRIEQRAMLCAA